MEPKGYPDEYQQALAHEVEATKSKWIRFDVHSFTGKTWHFDIHTTDMQHFLGEIKWFSRWRRYAFFPMPETVFEHECLKSIAEVCETLTKKHKLRKG